MLCISIIILKMRLGIYVRREKKIAKYQRMFAQYFAFVKDYKMTCSKIYFTAL